jgi:60 kDa SS-A/Ro ribonucleoprotein
MALMTLEAKPCCEVMDFASEFHALPLHNGMTLQACQRAKQGMSFGATDCAKPMTWAMAQKKTFDVFVVHTDC